MAAREVGGPSSDPLEASRFLDPRTLHIPERLGHVIESFVPDSKLETRNSKLVIHLQDLHTQAEAQRALGALIEQLHRATGASLIALEGGAGPGDTKFFSSFPDLRITQHLADFFLTKGLFTGPVAYAVTHPGEVSLYGAEDPTAYLEHLKIYQIGHPHQQAAAQHLAPCRRSCTSCKRSSIPKSSKTSRPKPPSMSRARWG